jgi:hypothetical protein
MAEYQVTYWRELPSLVTARDGEQVAKIELPSRFQEAIDQAAMDVGDVSSDAYLEGWRRGPWIEATGDPWSVAATIAAELEAAG